MVMFAEHAGCAVVWKDGKIGPTTARPTARGRNVIGSKIFLFLNLYFSIWGNLAKWLQKSKPPIPAMFSLVTLVDVPNARGFGNYVEDNRRTEATLVGILSRIKIRKTKKIATHRFGMQIVLRHESKLAVDRPNHRQPSFCAVRAAREHLFSRKTCSAETLSQSAQLSCGF
jgi:hypothetical protein